MTLQIDLPATAPSSEFFACADSADDVPVFVGGWLAVRDYIVHRPIETQPPEPGDASQDIETSVGAPQVGLRDKVRAFRARRELNRTFRRNQRQFENAMDAVAHDPAGQRELQSIWTSRR